MAGTGGRLTSRDSNPASIAVDQSFGCYFVPCLISQIKSVFSGLFTRAGLELRLGYWTLNSRSGAPFSRSSTQVRGQQLREAGQLALQSNVVHPERLWGTESMYSGAKSPGGEAQRCLSQAV